MSDTNPNLDLSAYRAHVTTKTGDVVSVEGDRLVEAIVALAEELEAEGMSRVGAHATLLAAADRALFAWVEKGIGLL